MLVVLYPVFLLGMDPNLLEARPLKDFSDTFQAVIVVLGFFLGALTIVAVIYFMGVPYWFVPYMVVVVLLWVVSRKKTKSQIYKMFIWSPLYLAILMTAFYVIVSYINFLPELFYLGDDILSTSLNCMFPAPIVLGYLFIGATAWIYDFLRRRNVIVDEESTQIFEDMGS